MLLVLCIVCACASVRGVFLCFCDVVSVRKECGGRLLALGVVVVFAACEPQVLQRARASSALASTRVKVS